MHELQNFIGLKIDEKMSYGQKIDFSTRQFLFLKAVAGLIFGLQDRVYAISVQKNDNKRFTFSNRNRSNCGTIVICRFGDAQTVSLDFWHHLTYFDRF